MVLLGAARGPGRPPGWQQLLFHQEPPMAPPLLPQNPPSSLPGSANVSILHTGRHRSRRRWHWVSPGPHGAACSFLSPPRFCSGISRPPPVLTAWLRHQNLMLLQRLLHPTRSKHQLQSTSHHPWSQGCPRRETEALSTEVAQAVLHPGEQVAPIWTHQPCPDAMP